MWEIEFTDEFGQWWDVLDEEEQESVAAGLTQEEVAASLGIKQPTLSRMESQDDMQVSTLQRLVRAPGGELEIIAHLPGRDIRIRQFTESA